jgi:hypothetical protein
MPPRGVGGNAARVLGERACTTTGLTGFRIWPHAVAEANANTNANTIPLASALAIVPRENTEFGLDGGEIERRIA